MYICIYLYAYTHTYINLRNNNNYLDRILINFLEILCNSLKKKNP